MSSANRILGTAGGDFIPKFIICVHTSTVNLFSQGDSPS